MPFVESGIHWIAVACTGCRQMGRNALSGVDQTGRPEDPDVCEQATPDLTRGAAGLRAGCRSLWPRSAHNGDSVEMVGQIDVLSVVYNVSGSGAVERRVRQDVEALARLGYTNAVVTDGPSESPLPPGVRLYAGLPIGAYWALPSPANELAAVAAVRRALRTALRSSRPRTIVFHHSTVGRAAVAAARSVGARSVFVVQALIEDRVSQRANPYGLLTTSLYKRENSFCLRHSDRVVCISDKMASVARAGGASLESIRVVANPVDTEFFCDRGTARDIDLLYLGRLSVEKGVDLLLQALSGIELRGRIVIAGDGPEGSRLRAEAERNAQPVEFVGRVDRNQVRDLLCRSRLLVVPSRSEPQGVVVLEALASGTPVIGSNVGGIPEMIRDGENGWLFRSHSSDDLRRAIVKAFQEPEKLHDMRTRARQSVQGFSLDELGDSIESAYIS